MSVLRDEFGKLLARPVKLPPLLRNPGDSRLLGQYPNTGAGRGAAVRAVLGLEARGRLPSRGTDARRSYDSAMAAWRRGNPPEVTGEAAARLWARSPARAERIAERARLRTVAGIESTNRDRIREQGIRARLDVDVQRGRRFLPKDGSLTVPGDTLGRVLDAYDGGPDDEFDNAFLDAFGDAYGWDYRLGESPPAGADAVMGATLSVA